MAEYHAASGSSAEDLFIELFSETFGAEKAGYLYSQYHFYDIYQNSRYADFVLENGARRVAIEVDDEASHNKNLVSSSKFYCFAQDVFARWSECVTDYEALRKALQMVAEWMKNNGKKSVALPYKMGCGLAGGDWETVQRIIEQVFRPTELFVGIWKRIEN